MSIKSSFFIDKVKSITEQVIALKAERRRDSQFQNEYFLWKDNSSDWWNEQGILKNQELFLLFII